MSTLADELLNDFEDSGSEGEAETENGGLFPEADGHAPTTNGNGETMELDGDEEEMEEDEGMTGAGNAIDVMDDEEATKAKVEKMQLGGVDDVRSVAGLMKTLEPVLEKISYFQNLPADKQTTHVGSIEDNPEYHLLTQSNTLSTSIDNEIILVHKFIRDHYSTRFPELETMVQNPLDYAKREHQAPPNLHRQHPRDHLGAVLDGPSLMIVTVEATTTKGRALTPPELSRVLRACEMTLSLDRAKRTLTDYVQSRMTLFAPNLTALIGSLTAAQLLNFAGGLTGLAKTPACNLASLGSKKTAGTGFATNVGARQQGFLYHSPIIAGVPPDLRRQAQRVVAAKLVLAARVHGVHSSASGAAGEELKAACLERLEKLTIPPPNKGARALPAPDDKPSRKRGGRRARKAKEATAMTDLRKAQNRMVFGKEEVEGGGDKQGVEEGRVRRLQIDPRTRAKLGKKNPGWGAATPAPWRGTASSLRGFGGGVGAMDLRGKGLRGSGGLELVDPKIRDEVARKRKTEEEGWFKGGTFTQVGGGNGGFKVPDAKRVKSGMGPPAAPGAG
ncbi:hypothetical protein VE04_05620 [Pseudogymnoascus sp. 24MN13]|nr:hypothetical protein VE04_05620 [Pseudogymnoascus sp. 24MN13]